MRKVIKAGEGRETARRLGWGLRETACLDGRPFLIARMPVYRSFQLDQKVGPSIKYLVISDGRVPSD